MENKVLTVIQSPQNGFMRGPIKIDFPLISDTARLAISIEQQGMRQIVFSAADVENINLEYVYTAYFHLTSLLMLFDGQFYPIVKIEERGIDVTSNIQKEILPCYESADFVLMLGAINHLIDFERVLSCRVFDRWSFLERELDLVHKMFLYCISSVNIPVDMKCAFLTESFIGLAELISRESLNFNLPNVQPNESKLQKYLEVVIENYGQKIFSTESQLGFSKFTRVLKESRNRIAHIKGKQGELYLSGSESVLYLCKLSLLYRTVLFNLLGIPDELYKEKIEYQVNKLNQWNGILDNFIAKF